jgi:hypothetical protein
MLGQLSHKGGARLDGTGRFEVYLNTGESSKAPCISEALKQYVRELFDFLMDPKRQQGEIGARTVVKRRSAAGNMMVDVTIFDGMNLRLIRGQGEFATLILELPFMGQVEFADNQMAEEREPEDEWRELDVA